MVDLSFVSANMMKVLEGGWFPLVVAAIVFFLMSTWWRGRHVLLRALSAIPTRYPISSVRFMLRRAFQGPQSI